MTDRLHDHLTIGFRRGCVACAQTEADLMLGKRMVEANKDSYPYSTEPAPVVS